MLFWIPYPLIRIAFWFIAGIVSAIYLDKYLPNLSFVVPFSLACLYFLLHRLLRNKFFSGNVIIGYFGFMTLFFLGFYHLQESDERIIPQHIVNQPGPISNYIAVIESPANQRKKSVRFEAEVTAIKIHNKWQSAAGKIYLYFATDEPLPIYGDRLLIKGHPGEIPPPGNPEEFDYRRFLAFKNIYRQDFLKKNDFLFVGHLPPNPVLNVAYQVRDWASRQLARFIISQREQGIAQALVLGIRDDLENELQQAYAATGAMHVLAVSGLHVGIVYSIIVLIFAPLRRYSNTPWIDALVGLTVLWCYALITGFSPSVLRACTMFSFIAVARAANRQTNIYNAIAGSAIILLLYDPYMIMSVAFQLSYLAVLGIVYLQPRVYRLYVARNAVIDWTWKLTSVSLAAQMATFPLSLYYFNQFPSLFFLSNIVVIPGAFLILVLGISVIILGFIPPVASLLGFILEKCIYIINEVIFTIQGLPHSQLTGVHINAFENWMIYGLIISFLLLFHFKKHQFAVLAIAPAVAFCICEFIGWINVKDEIIIYRIDNHTAIDFITGRHSFLYSDQGLRTDSAKISYHIQPYRLMSRIEVAEWLGPAGEPLMKELSEGIKLAYWKGVRFLMLNGPVHNKARYAVKPEVDYVLVSDGFEGDLNWIRKNIKFGKIVLDGSLTRAQAARWQKDLLANKIVHYSVYHHGALRITSDKF